MHQHLVAKCDIESLVGERQLIDTCFLEFDIFYTGLLGDGLGPWYDFGLMSMPVTWPPGMSLAKLTEMVPEPAPTSRSFKWGLDSLESVVWE